MMCSSLLSYAPYNFKSSPLKNDSWKMTVLLGWWLFRGELLNFRGVYGNLVLGFPPPASADWGRSLPTCWRIDPSWVLGFASVFVLDGLHLMPFLKLTASHTALLFFCWWFSLPKKPWKFYILNLPKKQRWMALRWFSGFQLVWIFCWFPAVHFQGFFPRRLLGRNSTRFGFGRNDSWNSSDDMIWIRMVRWAHPAVRKGRMTDKRHVMVMSLESDILVKLCLRLCRGHAPATPPPQKKMGRDLLLLRWDLSNLDSYDEKIVIQSPKVKSKRVGSFLGKGADGGNQA